MLLIFDQTDAKISIQKLKENVEIFFQNIKKHRELSQIPEVNIKVEDLKNEVLDRNLKKLLKNFIWLFPLFLTNLFNKPKIIR